MTPYTHPYAEIQKPQPMAARLCSGVRESSYEKITEALIAISPATIDRLHETGQGKI